VSKTGPSQFGSDCEKTSRTDRAATDVFKNVLRCIDFLKLIVSALGIFQLAAFLFLAPRVPPIEHNAVERRGAM